MNFRKITLGLLVLLATAAMPTYAQKITIDYARDFDFDGVATFTYVDTEASNTRNSLMHDRIRKAIVERLEAGGLETVNENPDLYVTYHYTSEENVVYDTTSVGYGGYGGYYGGWGAWGGGMATTSTTAHSYTQGTLIIDAYEPSGKKMIWRGTGTVTVKSTPDKQMKQVDKILSKMGAKWRKMLAGQGK